MNEAAKVIVLCFQMDAGHRSCTVNVTSGRNVVSLVINFPSHYPNNAIPSFEFTPDTSIDVSTKTKLMKVSSDISIETLEKALSRRR